MKRPALLTSLAVLLFSFPVAAAPAVWTVNGAPARAQITGGPWVLAEGSAASPLGSYPTPNSGTAAMQPFYQAFVTGDDTNLQGYFDYRIKDTEEAVVAASSHDRGATWTFQSKVLDFVSPSVTTPGAAASDAGEGHPFVATVAGHTWLYTLDRSTPAVDASGLIVRELTPTSADPQNGAPANAEVGSTTVTRTVGLPHPDGILGVVPGTSAPTRMMVLEKDISVTPFVTRLHLFDTMDGITFTNDQLVAGITDATTSFVGPRGTIAKLGDAHWGLFFSAGLVGEDADAFHYIGYAESADLVTWSVIHGVDNPLLSIDAAKDPTGGQPWYAGRVYAPSVTLSADGCSGVMTMSGYHETKPKASLTDYRQVGHVELRRDCASSTDAGADGGAGAADGGGPRATDAGGSGSGGVDAGSGGDGPSTGASGCNATGLVAGAPLPAGLAAVLAGALLGRRRRRRAARR